VPEGKQFTGKISVFRGKQAALNLAIFEALSKNPLIIYDITKRVKEQKPFYRLKPSIVGRRVRNLVNQGYLEEIGSRATKPGPTRKLYQLTTKAKVALHYQLVSREKFLNEADEETLTAELATLKLFLKKAGKSKSSSL
jgi:DNA-binding PadR family transcriptional regulator